MARVETIIVGGGVGGVAPFALNFIPYVSNTDPASISTTDFLSVVPTGATRGIIIGAADPDATATERLRISGGMISEGVGNDSLIIGRGADASGVGSICIGSLTGNTGSSGTVVIGYQSTNSQGGVVIAGTNTSGGSVNSVVIAGQQSGAGSTEVVVIGGSSNNSTGVVLVGGGGAITATNAVAVGFATVVAASGGIAIGSGASVGNAAHTNSITIGNGASSFAAQMLNIGSNASLTPINTVVVGHGVTAVANPTSLLYRQTNSSGTDNAAGSLTHQPGISTGNAAPGAYIIATGDQVAGSSTTLQTVTNKLSLVSSTTDTTFTLISPGVRNIRFNWQQAATVQAVEGVAGAANGIITGSAIGDWCLRSVNKRIIMSLNDGANIHLAVTTTAVARDTFLQIWDVDNAALERVTVGIADSGGVGFKLLRIPN